MDYTPDRLKDLLERHGIARKEASERLAVTTDVRQHVEVVDVRSEPVCVDGEEDGGRTRGGKAQGENRT